MIEEQEITTLIIFSKFESEHRTDRLICVCSLKKMDWLEGWMDGKLRHVILGSVVTKY